MSGRISQRDRLQAAADMVLDATRDDENAQAIIRRLEREHGAAYRRSPSTNLLRVAGCQATCTWSEADGLLDAWRRNATLKLVQLAGRSSSELERVS